MWPLLAGALVAFVATGVYAALAERVGFGDRGVGEEAARKLQARAVPPVGGLAVATSYWIVGAPGASAHALPAWFASPSSIAWALFAALLLGVLDDLLPRGLTPAWKLGGQLFAGVVLAAPTWGQLEPLPALGWTVAGALGAALSCNLWNTFDNADGAAGGLCGTGLCVLGLPAGAAVLGFLPWNLVLRRSGEVRAYLGDGGSHLLGMTVLVEPAAWPLAVLPALDLARVSILRFAAGQPPWVGDRRHLAHALQRRGLGPLAVCGVLVALGLLPLLPALLRG
ncbi:MAG: hypothetical protein H6831_13130 [Planctomycetes bacterium]|nr:hypothetical protein [Planctomycetota bacterium]MCB9905342.1 hypothetical protein [Planctomycetota bacterium]